MSKRKSFKTNKFCVDQLLVVLTSLHGIVHACRDTKMNQREGKALLTACENISNRGLNYFQRFPIPLEYMKKQSKYAGEASEMIEKVIDLFYVLGMEDPDEVSDFNQMKEVVDTLYQKHIVKNEMIDG